ncbi:MAG: B12-binding domain-containing radical SAM protein [Promethearchaeota archaeon]
MDILLIFPKVKYIHPSSKKDKDFFTKIFGESVSLTLPQIAAITPEEHHIEIIDENYEKLDFHKKVDLVGITCLTMYAKRAYEIADKFRSQGVPVILGGYHPSALSEEAKQHADSVVIGEAENIWPKLLDDFKKNDLKPFYISKEKIPPEKIPEPKRELLKKKFFSDAIIIHRGCPNRCEFCTLTKSYNPKFKPIKKVLDEIKRLNSKVILIYDSNFTLNIEYKKRLLSEFKKFNKRWLVQGTINTIGKNDEFLKIAKDAGLFSWYVGFESISQKSLDETNKKVNVVDDYVSSIQKIKDHDILIFGAFIFGFDNDGPDIFEKTYNSIKNWDVDMMDFHILTPYPGTVLYERLKKEGRILTKDWDKYNLANVVFQPKNMSAKELFERTRWITKKYYSIKNIIRRFYRSIERHKDFYLSFYVLQQNLRSRQQFKNLFDF